jgi:predicted hydrocarbon binding protein
VAQRDAAETEAELRTLMRLAYILDASAEGVLGKGAPAMMYQAGRDAGCAEGCRRGRTDDLEHALRQALSEGEDVWQFERWRDPGQDDDWVESNGRRSTWLVFRRCPLMSLTHTVGSSPGGLLCQATHGYLSGCMEMSLGHRVDMKIDHCGPQACKVIMEMRT